MTFYDKSHQTLFTNITQRMKKIDCYHIAVAYLISLDSVCREHLEDIFDFKNDFIKPECLHFGWQTDTSKKTLRLAFNLWNGCCSDGDTYTDKDGHRSPLPSGNYAVDSIFCSTYAPYYWEAVKLRYPEYTQ